MGGETGPFGSYGANRDKYLSFKTRSRDSYSLGVKSSLALQDTYGFTQNANGELIKLKYVDHNLAETATANALNVNLIYRGNSIVRPKYNTGTGVYQLSQIADGYQSYLVMGSKVAGKFYFYTSTSSPIDNNGVFFVFPMAGDTAGLPPGFAATSQVDVQPYLHWWVIWPGQTAQAGGLSYIVWDYYASTDHLLVETTRKEITGIPGAFGSPGSNPSKVWFWNLYFRNTGAQDLLLTGDLTIVYHTLVFGRKTLAGGSA